MSEDFITEDYEDGTEETTILPDEPTVEEPPSPETLDVKEAEDALNELRPTLLAIPKSDVRPLKAGATSVVGIGLAYAQAFADDRQLFAETFKAGAFDAAAHDDLAERAKAFWRADIKLRQEHNSEGPVRLLMLEAKPLRKKLMKAAEYLWGEDPELGDVVASIRRGNGNANQADDLGSLATLFTEHWSRAAGQCNVTQEDIDEALRLGAQILQAMSPSRSEVFDDVRALRHRAAEHLRRGIEEVRAAAGYIFRSSPKEMERYPSMFVRKRRKAPHARAAEEVSSELAPPAVTRPEEMLDEPSLEAPLLPHDDEAIAQQG